MPVVDDNGHIDVSVVVAAYNAERTVCAAVLSALQQEGVRLEVLVGDDASTDETVVRLGTIDDARLRVFRNEINAGAGITRDRLIDQARGEYIAFLDADDCYCPGRLARIMQVARRFPGALVFDDIHECHDAPTGLVPFRRVHGADAFRSGQCGGEPRPVTLTAFITAKRLLVKAVFPRKRALQAGVRHTRHRYGEDGLFLWTLVARGIPAIYLPEPFYLYRVTPGSLSANPQRYVLLADCFAELLRENLSPVERRLISTREVDFRDLAVLRSVPGQLSPAKIVAAARYFAGGPGRLPRWLASFFLQLAYTISRHLAGAPKR